MITARKLFLILAGLVTSSGLACAQIDTFTGAVNDDYGTAGNWSTGLVPVTSNGITALINNGAAVTYTPGGDLLISNGGMLEITSGSFTQLVNNNWIQLGEQGAGPSTGHGAILVNGGTFNQGTSGNDPFNVTGTGNTFTLSSGAANFTNALEIKPGLTYTQSGGTAGSPGALQVDNGGAYSQSNGTVTVGGNVVTGGGFTLSGGTINATSGEFDFNTATTTISGGVVNTKLITGVNSGGVGILTFSGGVINLSNSSSQNSPIYAGGPQLDYINFTTGSTAAINFTGAGITPTQVEGYLTNGAVEHNSVVSPYDFYITTPSGEVSLALQTGEKDGTWVATGNGNWSDSTTWQNDNAPGLNSSFTNTDTATFGTVSGAAAAITVDLTTPSPSIAALTFDSSATAYTIAQGTVGATLTMSSSTGTAAINVDLGEHFISAPVVLASNTAINAAGGTMLTLSGGISGNGGLAVSGGGTVKLSSANTYAGGTSLSSGMIMAGNQGALGTGAVTQSGGTLETDNVNHTIAMGSTAGNNFDQTGGTLTLNLNGAPGAGNNDVVNVTGTATLGGNLKLVYNAGALAPAQSETYTVITTTGGINSVNAAGYEPPALEAGALKILISSAVVGDDFEVTLTGQQTSFVGLTGTNLMPNQQHVAAYLDRLDSQIIPAAVLPLYQALDGISVNPGALGGAFDQLTPLKFENFAISNAFNNTSFLTEEFDNYLAGHRGSDGTFVGSNGGIDYSGLTVGGAGVDPGLQEVYSHLLAWSPEANAGLVNDVGDSVLGGVETSDSKMIVTPESTQPLNFFVAGNAVLAQDFSDSATGLSHVDATTGAVQIGVDYRITPHLLVGAEFGYGHTDATLDTLGSTASVDTYAPALYASYCDQGWYANALGSYGFTSYGQDRNVSIGAFTGTAHSSPSGDQIIGDLDGGYDYHAGAWTVGPTLGVQYVHLDVNGFTETGLPGANLAVDRDETDSLRSSLGGRVAYTIRDGDMIFTPHLNAGWQHEFLDQSRGITSQFSGLGVGSFVVNTPKPSRDSALINLGLDAQVNKTITVFSNYTVQAGQSNYFGQSIEAGGKIGF